MFARIVPLAGILLFALIGVVWRGWLQYRKYGNIGIVLFQTTDFRRRLRDALFVFLFIAIVVQTIIFAVSPAATSGLRIADLPAAVAWLGGLLLVGGLALTVAAQLGMGASWRIGIDEAANPGLVTAGLYQFCRNPIYLGMMASLIGLAVLLPTWLSLALTAGIAWCIRTQTIEEEVYLEQTYGQAFRLYAARVGRFWPGLGKLCRQ